MRKFRRLREYREMRTTYIWAPNIPPVIVRARDRYLPMDSKYFPPTEYRRASYASRATRALLISEVRIFPWGAKTRDRYLPIDAKYSAPRGEQAREFPELCALRMLRLFRVFRGFPEFATRETRAARAPLIYEGGIFPRDSKDARDLPVGASYFSPRKYRHASSAGCASLRRAQHARYLYLMAKYCFVRSKGARSLSTTGGQIFRPIESKGDLLISGGQIFPRRE